MKKLFIVANWKSNKITSETNEWFQTISNNTNKEIIVCPSFTLLPSLKSLIINHKSNIKLGVQDISPFDEGAYTGEINGRQIKEFADYVIVGHSERRRYFSEDNSLLEKKVEMAKKFDVTTIFCVQDYKTPIPEGVNIVAYEPVFAIGSGKPDSPGNAEEMAKIIKEKNNIEFILYGGSVNSQNIKTFTDMPNINGALIGGASLNAKEFEKIIQNA